MKRLILLAAFVLLCASKASAQLQVPSFANDPATCDPTRGLVYYNTTSTVLKVCSALNTWSQLGSATVPVAGPGLFQISTNCLTVSNCFVIHADLQAVSDATFTASANTIATGTNDPPFCNGTTLPCTSAQIAQGHTTDVGTVYAGFDNCRAVNEAACDYNCPQGTIASVVDAHDVTLSGTCTRNSSVTTNSNNFYWGSDDSTQLTAAWTAAMNYAQFTGPSAIKLPCGRIGMGTQSFIFYPVSGVIHYTVGIEGCGEGGITEIVPFPKMNCTGAFGGQKGCLLILGYAQDQLGNFSTAQTARNITFNGYGLPDADGAATVNAGENGVSISLFDAIYNVNVQGWYWNRSTATPVYGIWCNGGTITNSSSYAGGNFGIFMQGFGGNQAPCSMHGGSAGGSVGPSIDIGTGQTATYGVYVNQNEGSCFATSICYGLRNITSGSNHESTGDQITTGVWTGTGAKTTLKGGILNGFGGQTYSYYVDTGTGVLSLEDENITNHAHVVGGTVLDKGGNTGPVGYTGLDAFTGGSFVADGHSVKGICTGVGTASQTLGLYGTGANVDTTTCTSTTIGAGIPVAGARTLGGLMVTATAAGTNASSGVVTVLKNGSATTITCTIGTATSCSDFTHSVTTADGDLISIQFTTQAADTLAGVKAFIEWQ